MAWWRKKQLPKLQNISDHEWEVARKLAETYSEENQTHTFKLRRKSHSKLTHSFICIKGKLYALQKHIYLGSGSHGKIKVLQARDKQVFVVKITQQKEAKTKREIENLNHLKRLHAVFKRNQTHKNYIVMDYIPGISLRDLLVRRNLSTLERVKIGYEIIRKLAELHSLNLIHCDLKPGNILVQKKGKKYQVNICDVGGSIKLETGHRKAKFDSLICTMGYIDPYIYHRSGKLKLYISQQFDLFSLGIILYDDLDLETDNILACIENKPSRRPSVTEMLSEFSYLKQQLDPPLHKKLLWGFWDFIECSVETSNSIDRFTSSIIKMPG